jgi:methylated-DNA-protein-cysteine methyltransferase-like protein
MPATKAKPAQAPAPKKPTAKPAAPGPGQAASGKKPPASAKSAASTGKRNSSTPAKTAAGEKAAAIIATLKAIPKGHVTSYGEVARRAGLPGYARFVCRVLRELPDRETPWWRVIRSDGKFAMGITTGAGKIQYTRLKDEGLEIKGERVVGPWW